ncbi:MAG: hypothetical protein JWM99_1705 [Verrucomicrobiales bacterium]|nr:hypothetical protein [Verrucomicrobiales bacterium]
MSFLGQISKRLRALFQKQEFDVRMNEEMRSHIEMQTQENIEAGMEPQEARYAALRGFGWIESIKRTCREQRAVGWLENLGQDVRLGIRLLIKTPGFTIVTILTLVLGIGVNLLLFALLDNEFLSPRAVLRPEEIWSILPSDISGEPKFFNLSRPYYEAVRKYNRVFKNVVGVTSCNASLVTQEGLEKLRGQMVSGDYFDFLGVKPFLGRGFLPEENDKPGMHSVVVLSFEIWRRHFNADPAVQGKTLTLRGADRNLVLEIVGVAPPGFLGMGSIPHDFWVATSLEMDKALGYFPTYSLFGRLDAAITPSVAADALTVIVRDVTKTLHAIKYERYNAPTEANNNSAFTRVAIFRAGYGTILPEWIHYSRHDLIKLNGLAAFGTVSVLAMAAFNLANLFLARAFGRRREMATRIALGAPRWALVRQLTIEGTLLAGVATVGTLFVLSWFGHAAPGLFSAVVYNSETPLNLHPDVRVVVFSIVTAFLVGIGFSMPPALCATRFDPFVVLKESNADGSARARRWSMRKGLVTLQVAGSLVLLAGVSLSLSAIGRQLRIDPGFPPDQLIVAKLDLEKIGYSMESAPTVCEELRRRISSMPGIETVGIMDKPPFLEGHNSVVTDQLAGHEGSEVKYVQVQVGPEGFHALGIPMLVGREVTSSDFTGRQHVVLVNENFVRTFWPDQVALGKKIGWIKDKFEVIGIVRDARLDSPAQVPKPTIYMAMRPYFALTPTFIVRTKSRPEALLGPIRAELKKFYPGLDQNEIFTMREAMRYPFTAQRNVTNLLGGIAAIALSLTVLGAYGLLSCVVSQRTHEIGVRLAIGARKSDVAKHFLRMGFRIALTGVLLGLPMAFCGSLLLRHIIFAVRPLDLAAFAIATGLVLLAILMACWLPVRRATRVDPIMALRYE